MLCASEITGRSITEIEFVNALGNRTRGRAIPVKTPYIDRASADDRPNNRSCPGMEMASTLARILIISRFAESGAE